MSIDAIPGLSAARTAGGQPAPGVTEPGGGDALTFAGMIDGLAQQQTQADTALIDLSTDGEQDLADVVLAVEMESIAFELAIQIRNRLVDAYHEIFRMSI